MNITKGEFCQFSLNSRSQILKEFGNYICQNIIGNKAISIFKVYGFYVESIYDKKTRMLERIEPISQPEFISFYQRTNQ